MTTVRRLPAQQVRDVFTPAAALGAALRGEPCLVIGARGTTLLQTGRWRGEPDESDEPLLTRCQGATVDIGCGPGRMTAALLRRGVAALGIDIVPTAVEQARARGGIALQRDVFATLPGEGRWDTALLADGNIGIGGDPLRLLRRAGDLLGPRGRVVVELTPPGGQVRVHRIRLEVNGRRTRRFPWAVVPADTIAALADAAALQVLEVLEQHGRWVAELARSSR